MHWLGLLPWKADTGKTIFIKCYYSSNVAETIITPTDVVHLNLQDTRPIIHRLTQPAQYELFHQRFGHPGERTMSILHKNVDHVPQLKGNSFYRCASCLHAKSKQRPHNTTLSCKNTNSSSIMNDSTTQNETLTSEDTSMKDTTPIQCGQHFNIDFGFMRGSGYCTTDEEGRTITSIDGYRSYCLIIDRLSRYTWVFLTKTKGGELWHSQQFQQMAMDSNYILEPTAAGAPFQNGLAERPNQTFGNMVRCLLHSANLGPEYWSFALLHSVYIKNRLLHSAIQETPYKLYTGQRPSARNLRVFGCPIITKQPGKRNTKLDIVICMGLLPAGCWAPL